jgi:hypothetical protein
MDIPSDQLDRLRNRATELESWAELPSAIDPADGLTEPYRSVREANFYWWSAGHGRKPYSMPVPELEVRRGTADGREYVSVTNHSEQDTVTAPLPWAAGREIRELTSDDPSPRSYGENDTTTFETESVNVYELLE